jgi:hypothetical protein
MRRLRRGGLSPIKRRRGGRTGQRLADCEKLPRSRFGVVGWLKDGWTPAGLGTAC